MKLTKVTDEYIRRQDAVNMFNRAVQDVGILDADDIETVFGMLSSVDVVPVVRGTWKHHMSFGICDKCGYEYNWTGADAKNYCPNCGAKMD